MAKAINGLMTKFYFIPRDNVPLVVAMSQSHLYVTFLIIGTSWIYGVGGDENTDGHTHKVSP